MSNDQAILRALAAATTQFLIFIEERDAHRPNLASGHFKGACLSANKAAALLRQLKNAPAEEHLHATIKAQDEELYKKMRAAIQVMEFVTIPIIQRFLACGYNPAARLMEAFESRGVVAARDKDGKHEVLEKTF